MCDVQANGHRVMVISPRYDQYKDAWDTSVIAEVTRTLPKHCLHPQLSKEVETFFFYCTLVCLFQIKVADRYERVRFFHCYKRGVDRVFIDHPSFLEKVCLLVVSDMIPSNSYCCCRKHSVRFLMAVGFRFGERPARRSTVLTPEWITRTTRCVSASFARSVVTLNYSYVLYSRLYRSLMNTMAKSLEMFECYSRLHLRLPGS